MQDNDLLELHKIIHTPLLQGPHLRRSRTRIPKPLPNLRELRLIEVAPLHRHIHPETHIEIRQADLLPCKPWLLFTQRLLYELVDVLLITEEISQHGQKTHPQKQAEGKWQEVRKELVEQCEVHLY